MTAHFQPHPAVVKNKPNVLLLTVDALRADRTSLHGYHRPTTPNLDRLRHELIHDFGYDYSDNHQWRHHYE